MTRVAMIIQGYHPLVGGAERQLGTIAPRLQQHGIDVHVLTRRYPGLAPFEYINGIPVHRLPIPGPYQLASTVFTLVSLPLIRRLRPDVLHAHELLSPTTTALAAKRVFGIPVAAKILRGGTMGDLDRLGRNRLSARRIPVIRERVDALITISHEIAAELAALGVQADRRPFIPNGVDTQRFHPGTQHQKQQIRHQLGLPDGLIGVYTGRLVSEKRVDQLVACWTTVRMSVPDATLVLLGTGPEAATLEATAGAGVHFAGSVEDVVPYLQAADVFVLPSATEGLSNALLEAMAVGLPCVATRVGGAADCIEHGISGWLIEPDAPHELEVALTTLFNDPELRLTLGQNARQYIEQNYALPVIISKLVDLYQRLKQQPLVQVYRSL